MSMLDEIRGRIYKRNNKFKPHVALFLDEKLSAPLGFKSLLPKVSKIDDMDRLHSSIQDTFDMENRELGEPKQEKVSTLNRIDANLFRDDPQNFIKETIHQHRSYLESKRQNPLLHKDPSLNTGESRSLSKDMTQRETNFRKRRSSHANDLKIDVVTPLRKRHRMTPERIDPEKSPQHQLFQQVLKDSQLRIQHAKAGFPLGKLFRRENEGISKLKDRINKTQLDDFVRHERIISFVDSRPVNSYVIIPSLEETIKRQTDTLESKLLKINGRMKKVATIFDQPEKEPISSTRNGKPFRRRNTSLKRDGSNVLKKTANSPGKTAERELGSGEKDLGDLLLTFEREREMKVKLKLRHILHDPEGTTPEKCLTKARELAESERQRHYSAIANQVSLYEKLVSFVILHNVSITHGLFAFLNRFRRTLERGEFYAVESIRADITALQDELPMQFVDEIERLLQSN